MAAYDPRTIQVPTSTTDGPDEDGNGAPINVSGQVEKWVRLFGTWNSGDVTLELSLDNGATYVAANADVTNLTADTAIIEIPQGGTHLRCVTNAGTPDVTCQLCGLELAKTPRLTDA